ncbi:DUF523 domain-containing protein [Thalassotalea aquiviva]|uniref:DUF523 domain-containing protein n=1 Tax=Thalassotalea aquiviva TaxID=3242415 RepID=UPI00352A7A5D
MEKILISSCLLGNKVRYDGEAKAIAHPQITQWHQQNRFVVLCPEVAGGLSIPRARAEQYKDQVFDEFGHDVTKAFIQGANKALALCQQHQIKFALLKEFSPSCGANFVYDGSFSGQKIEGMGVTATLLLQHQIQVFSELQIEQLQQALKSP